MSKRRDILLTGGAALGLAACARLDNTTVEPVEIFDPAAESLIGQEARLEILANGFTWAEGPAWDRARDCLYFTDVPENRAFRWSGQTGLEVFLDPSGVAPDNAAGMREPGANGLWYGADGHLYVCNHGTRSVERLDLDDLSRVTLVDRFEAQRFNSPNDLVVARDGRIYFTDPPYGLEGLDASPLKEMTWNGVYCLEPGGACHRLTDIMTFPNGVALSPDESWLYVAQSDPEAPVLRRFPLHDGRVAGVGNVIFDGTDYLAAGEAGLPDGMAVTVSGHILMTGPGGVFLLASDGRALARIRTGSATANCAFGGDGQDLYITAQDRLLRMRLSVRGLQWS
jgi:gluconolactonase